MSQEKIFRGFSSRLIHFSLLVGSFWVWTAPTSFAQSDNFDPWAWQKKSNEQFEANQRRWEQQQAELRRQHEENQRVARERQAEANRRAQEQARRNQEIFDPIGRSSGSSKGSYSSDNGTRCADCGRSISDYGSHGLCSSCYAARTRSRDNSNSGSRGGYYSGHGREGYDPGYQSSGNYHTEESARQADLKRQRQREAQRQRELEEKRERDRLARIEREKQERLRIEKLALEQKERDAWRRGMLLPSEDQQKLSSLRSLLSEPKYLQEGTGTGSLSDLLTNPQYTSDGRLIENNEFTGPPQYTADGRLIENYGFTQPPRYTADGYLIEPSRPEDNSGILPPGVEYVPNEFSIGGTFQKIGEMEQSGSDYPENSLSAELSKIVASNAAPEDFISVYADGQLYEVPRDEGPRIEISPEMEKKMTRWVREANLWLSNGKEVAKVEGTVRVRRSMTNDFLELREGDIIYPGDIVNTGSNSRVKLVGYNGATPDPYLVGSNVTIDNSSLGHKSADSSSKTDGLEMNKQEIDEESKTKMDWQESPSKATIIGVRG